MTYDELGKTAYTAFCQKACEVDEEGLADHALTWDDLDDDTRSCWIEAGSCASMSWMKSLP